MKILIIANPIASGGDAGQRAKLLAAILKRRGHRPDIHLTRFAGDGRQRAAQLQARSFDRICVVGGDGTLNEIISGLGDTVSIPLLHLPTGNANLLARDLHLPKSPVRAARLLETGRLIHADVGEISGLKFIMIAGAGFDAKVTEQVAAVRTGRVSNLSYVLPVARVFRKSKESRFQVMVDDHRQAEGDIVLVCNVRSYGGICEIAHGAGVDSGVLDVVVLPEESPAAIARYFFMARFSRITRLKGVRYFQGTRITITSKSPIPLQLDGDFTGRFQEVRIALKPRLQPLIGPGTTPSRR